MACKKTKNEKKRYCLGDFRHSIRILNGKTFATTGDYDVENNTILSTRAIVKTTSGSVFHNGVVIQTDTTHKFTIRFTQTQISKNYMILFKEEYYNIESIENENEDSLYLIIRASKRGDSKKESAWR